MVGAQTAEQASVLSKPLRTHLRNEEFVAITSVAGLPIGVRDGLKSLFASPTLELAEPGAEFQVTDEIMKPNLPVRRLILAGCSADHCLVYYERGGIAHTWYVVVFQSTKTGAKFEWGGSAPSGLANLDELKRAVVSKEVRGETAYW
jgi:hypothetical protein